MAKREKIWLPIPGHVGYYAASNDGEIMSMNYRGTGLPGVLASWMDRYGYLKHIIYKNKKPFYRMAHRLVAAAFLGESILSVNHINGVKTDNRIENLEYCSIADNVRKGHAMGLFDNVRGENSGNHKLTDEKVVEIHRLLSLGFPQHEVASMIGTTQSNVSQIRNGITWAHLLPEKG